MVLLYFYATIQACAAWHAFLPMGRSQNLDVTRYQWMDGWVVVYRIYVISIKRELPYFGNCCGETQGQTLDPCSARQGPNHYTTTVSWCLWVCEGYSWFIAAFAVPLPLLVIAVCCSPLWRRGREFDCGSGDPGSIPGITSPRERPLMTRKKKTSTNVPVFCRGRFGT